MHHLSKSLDRQRKRDRPFATKYFPLTIARDNDVVSRDWSIVRYKMIVDISLE